MTLVFDHARSDRLLDHFHIHRTLISMPLFEAPESYTEYLLHEVGHALSLGIPVEGRFSAEIHRRLKHAAAFGSDIRNEAYVLAAESILYRHADHPIARAEILAVAKNQEVPVCMLDNALCSRRAIDLAIAIARWALAQQVFVACADTCMAIGDLRIRASRFPPRRTP